MSLEPEFVRSHFTKHLRRLLGLKHACFEMPEYHVSTEKHVSFYYNLRRLLYTVIAHTFDITASNPCNFCPRKDISRVSQFVLLRSLKYWPIFPCLILMIEALIARHFLCQSSKLGFWLLVAAMVCSREVQYLLNLCGYIFPYVLVCICPIVAFVRRS